MGFADLGDPEGEPVFYFHGWPATRLQALLAVEEAKKRGLRVIAPDRPGMGFSSYHPGRQLLDWPPLLARLADALEIERFSVLGVSGGGPYACVSAWALPERVTRVGVCCGAPPLAEFSDIDGLMWIFRALMPLKRHAPWLLPGLLRLPQFLFTNLPPALALGASSRLAPAVDGEAIRRPDILPLVAATVQEAFRYGPEGVLAEVEIYLRPWGFRPEDISVPMRFWHGAKDGTLPLDKTRWLAERIPGASFVEYPAEGHYSLPINQYPTFLGWLQGEDDALSVKNG